MSATSPTPDDREPMENYFHYFSEIDECFQRCRGTPTLVSPLDWALIESWKEAGIPLEAVLAGVNRSFEKVKKRRPAFRRINSLAYCTQEVLRAYQELGSSGSFSDQARNVRAEKLPFEPGQVRTFFKRNLQAVEEAKERAGASREETLSADLAQVARALGAMAAEMTPDREFDFQETEARLTALEEKLTASFTRASTPEQLAEFQREVDRGLERSRRNMTVPQIESLSRQFLKRRLFECYQVPRLSLFYM